MINISKRYVKYYLLHCKSGAIPGIALNYSESSVLKDPEEAHEKTVVTCF